MSDILNHAAMQDGRVVLAESVGAWVFPVESAVGECLHDAPEVLHILLTDLPGHPVGDDDVALGVEVCSPALLILEGESTVVFLLHCQRILI